MVGEMDKKRVGQGCIFHVNIPPYFLMKILLVNLKTLHTSACLKLNQRCKGCEDGGIYQNL